MTRLSILIIVIFGIAPLFNTQAQEKVHLENIVIIGNERTKEQVILRELAFEIGDSILLNEFELLKTKSIQTLTNTSLFNFIEISSVPRDQNAILIVVKVTERWFIWPGIVFSLAETNFNSWWQNKDFERINYGFYVQDMNFRGRREKVTLELQNGWKRKIGIDYQVPGINKKRTIGAGLKVFYARNRELNYGSFNNERLFFKDEKFIQEEFTFEGKMEFRPRLYNKHRLAFGLNTVIINDTVNTYNTTYLPIDRNRSQYFYFNYGFKREKRDNIGYPLKGYVFDASIDQEGLGLIHKDDIMMTKGLFTFNLHNHLGGRWYFAQGLKGKYTFYDSNNVPYYFQRGLGYSSASIRGYELVVIDGQHYASYKSNIKYQLIKKKTVDLNFGIANKFDKFHYSVFLNAFADAGYVVDNINAAVNPLANNWQYACGLGLDFVTYYDIVIRFEGSINKQGQPGFYIHFKNPI
jgi:outer membrane protein assembly factor BamA